MALGRGPFVVQHDINDIHFNTTRPEKLVGSYWNASDGNADEYDFVLNRDGGGRGTVHVQGNELIHCGMFIRNYTVDIHLQNTGIGCAWYELDPTTSTRTSLSNDISLNNES